MYAIAEPTSSVVFVVISDTENSQVPISSKHLTTKTEKTRKILTTN